ncbi:MAG: hypothetical protein QHH05_00960 [Syntrophomonadaceae bacterium]|jgi:hypothetical protein|nr:hypothetical protein [Syntrophomonadaceae bacterium]MDH7497004.1 hypothetical protein [Syntrophomonadaceae bacterium]
MDNRAFLYTLVNKLFLAISEQLERVPGGECLLEQVIESLSRRVFEQFESDYYPMGTTPVDYATSWIRLLGRQGFLNENHYEFRTEGEDIHVAIFNGSCAYREYCAQAHKEGLLFLCPRMTSIKWIIARSMGSPYHAVTEKIDCEGMCLGVIRPGNPCSLQDPTAQGPKDG